MGSNAAASNRVASEISNIILLISFVLRATVNGLIFEGTRTGPPNDLNSTNYCTRALISIPA